MCHEQTKHTFINVTLNHAFALFFSAWLCHFLTYINYTKQKTSHNVSEQKVEGLVAPMTLAQSHYQ
jgi:hypothetical protein